MISLPALLALAPLARGADPVVDAVQTEIDRAMAELALPEAPGPYYISAQILDVEQVNVTASLGGIVGREVQPVRTLGATVRSGSEALDNTNFETFRDGTGERGLVVEDRALAIRHDAWLLLDRLYKESVESLAAKEAAIRRRADPDRGPDFAPGAPVVAEIEAAPRHDAERLTALAVRLSSVFLGHPDVEWSSVFVSAEAGRRVMLDTGGTRVTEPASEIAVRTVARVRAPDGATQVDQVLHVVRTLGDLPDEAALVAEVDALAARLEAWRALPVLDDEYVGPVLLADGAAADAVRHLLAPALLGTPPEESPPTGSRIISFEESKPAAMQPHRRMLPSGWRVDDDPQRDPRRASAYTHDCEGQPAQRVELVVDGIVQGHLMSRIPSDAFPASNGHGRAAPGELVRAQPADLAVTAPRATSPKKLRKAALRIAAEYGSDHYVEIHALRDPSIDWMDGGPLLSLRDFTDSPAIPAPIELVRVYRDGHTEKLRGAVLGGMDLRSFKEVVAAGDPWTITVESGDGSVFSGPNVGFPVTYTAPDLLFGELVLSPDPANAERPPRLPSPLAQRQ